MEPRKQDVEYYPDHNGDFFYIRVNDTGRNFRLVKAQVSDPRSANWREVIPQRTDVKLNDTDFFKDYYILYERENGLPQMRVADLRGGEPKRIAFPEPAYDCYSYINREYDTTKFRYGYQSFITPPSVYEFDMTDGKSTLLKQKEVPGGYDRVERYGSYGYPYEIGFNSNLFSMIDRGVVVAVAHIRGGAKWAKTGTIPAA